jgi:SAM-dependent methyltransferase
MLEIGAGTGQQAKSIENEGYAVVAIDLPSSYYRDDRIYDVVEYDGRTIPMPDRAADVVFSSNVLEHVLEIDTFLDETNRVMAEDGVAVHILPSSACRLWSIPAHYVWLTRRLYARMVPRPRPRSVGDQRQGLPHTPQSAREWLGTLFPLRHGERGVTLTEPYYYSRYWWRRKFRQHGFDVVRVEPNELFYTMANALTDKIPIGKRVRLSHLLGSACHIYVLKKHRD